MTKQRRFGVLAQSVEHLTFDQVVRGSNPRCLIKTKGTHFVMGSFYFSDEIEGFEPRVEIPDALCLEEPVRDDRLIL